MQQDFPHRISLADQQLFNAKRASLQPCRFEAVVDRLDRDDLVGREVLE